MGELIAKSEAEEDSLDDMVAELRKTFREEAYELVTELETALLELEKAPGEMEVVGRVFRAMHTIKGSGATCRLNDIASFTHELETIFDMVRKGRIAVTPELINLALRARDQIKAMLDRLYQGKAVDEALTQKITSLLKKRVSDSIVKRAQTGSSQLQGKASTDIAGENATYRIRFQPAPDTFSHGTNLTLLLNQLRELGHCHVAAQTDNIPYLENINPETCYTSWDAIVSTPLGRNAIEDVFIFVRNGSELKIEVIDEEGAPVDEAAYKKLGEILIERGDLSSEALQQALNAKKRVGEVLVEIGVIPEAKVESALTEQQHVREMRERRQGAEASASIRVATAKLDSLVNLVGELVTVQARLTQTALSTGLPALQSIAEEVERLTASLRDNTMDIRMLPIGTTFSKFKRLVRDLSSELGKEIEMTAGGAETELDKTVIERLSDPLVHIIRNSIDHGIELPAARTAAGKPKKGTIHLSALHSGAHVLIQVQDDGAGLDGSAIRAKAVEKGLIQPDVELPEHELWELILAPGFSTAKQVSGVSGRGVGMDVVKKAIDALRGTIEIMSSKGKGTTITLKLPLTLAIIDGFLTRTGDERLIFPLSLVEECVELGRADMASEHGRQLAHVRGQIVPYIRLRDYFMISGGNPAYEQIVITGVDGRRVGFVVDMVIGEHQTVLKSLGKFYKDVEGISGATILGDGTVALILDIPKLVRMVALQEEQMTRGGANLD